MNSSEENNLPFLDPVAVVRDLGIRDGMKIADIGAGSGEYAFAMASLVGDTGRVYAMDVQKEMLTRIANEADKRELKILETIWGDIDRTGGSKLADSSMDLVLISNTLFQLESKETAFSEIYRILKPGGVLAIVEWSDSFNNMGPHSDEVVNKQQATSLANAAGFVLEREFTPGSHHYGLLLKRQ